MSTIDVNTSYHVPHPDTSGYRVVISTTYKTKDPEVWERMKEEAMNTISSGLGYQISDEKYKGMSKCQKGESL